MLGLTPAKLLIIFVVVVVVLGPNRLPEVARQLGRSWQRIRDLQQRVDQDLRRSVPNLPSSDQLVRIARSPMTLLNELASMPSVDPASADPASADPASADPASVDPDAPRPGPAAPAPPAPHVLGIRGPVPAPTPGAGAVAGTGPAAFPLQPSDDPGMN